MAYLKLHNSAMFIQLSLGTDSSQYAGSQFTESPVHWITEFPGALVFPVSLLLPFLLSLLYANERFPLNTVFWILYLCRLRFALISAGKWLWQCAHVCQVASIVFDFMQPYGL